MSSIHTDGKSIHTTKYSTSPISVNAKAACFGLASHIISTLSSIRRPKAKQKRIEV
jgi:hypothetical protein